MMFKVGLDKANKSPDTRLLYVTTGVLKVCSQLESTIFLKKHCTISIVNLSEDANRKERAE